MSDVFKNAFTKDINRVIAFCYWRALDSVTRPTMIASFRVFSRNRNPGMLYCGAFLHKKSWSSYFYLVY